MSRRNRSLHKRPPPPSLPYENILLSAPSLFLLVFQIFFFCDSVGLEAYASFIIAREVRPGNKICRQEENFNEGRFNNVV